jgi:hypothetical protein
MSQVGDCGPSGLKIGLLHVPNPEQELTETTTFGESVARFELETEKGDRSRKL